MMVEAQVMVFLQTGSVGLSSYLHLPKVGWSYWDPIVAHKSVLAIQST